MPLCRHDDPDRWLRLTYATGYDDYVVTQVDDGHPDGPGLGGSMLTSSASSPAIVAVMLAALDASVGHRVLEIGTGTGYTRCCWPIGSEPSTSPASRLTPTWPPKPGQRCPGPATARSAWSPATGALGYPPEVPYDRIIATAAVHSVPCPWVAQTRPGGRILLPWANSYTGALVALTVDDHDTARGGIVSESSFMWLRAQRERRGPVGDVVGEDEDRAAVHLTQLHPHSVAGDQGARFTIGQRVPRCQWRYWPYDEQTGTGVLWLLDFRSRSWAKLTHTTPDASDGEFRVHQYGPRQLWDEVHAAHQWWIDQGKPDPDRWRFTVTPQTQHIELA